MMTEMEAGLMKEFLVN